MTLKGGEGGLALQNTPNLNSHKHKIGFLSKILGRKNRTTHQSTLGKTSS